MDPSLIDLYLLIHTAFTRNSSSTLSKPLSLALFNLITHLNFFLARKHFALQRKSLSIRDILAVVEFVGKTMSVFKEDVVAAFHNAVEMVVVDGLCLGLDVDRQRKEIIAECRRYISRVEEEVLGRCHQDKEDQYVNNGQVIGVDPFHLPILSRTHGSSDYAFHALTTKSNLKKLLRAYQLNKPILIEGPPGVGKTSLVENLARVSGRKLVRVNLSEQTDMMDLLGSEYPAKSETTAVGEEDEEIRFAWCDGVLLRALKEGHWFLIDEMNLA